ncbi:MAG: endonuclease domain-containing protein [Alphaproteobacteria bacterium]|nr:endonuclease domain-containing protein [Alphaproteobacteria bacterium]
MDYKAFVFEDYCYDPAASTLRLHYRFSEGPRFEEQLVFDFTSRRLSLSGMQVLDRIFRLIFLLSGVSYYKAFVPKLLSCEAFALDKATARFVQTFYEKGLAEFAFTNALPLGGHLSFEADSAPAPAPIELDLPRSTLVPVGGGKDSIVTIECLRQGHDPVVLFSLGDAEPINACIRAADLPFVRVHRQLDNGLVELNRAGALNGHVPITGILSAIALACAVLCGCDTVAMSNEHSANAPNLTVDGLEVNHQFSKSLQFETDFAEYTERFVSPSLHYFSLLRPLSEIEIARRFANYPAYFGVFRSCNAAFKQSRAARRGHWCCNCPKCRFVFLALAPFVGKSELTGIFGGNLLDDRAQRDGFAQLCGLQEHKPFECVGETAESAAVMAHLADHPDWRADAVVRELSQTLALRQKGPTEYRALFEARHPHRVPARYLAMLDACS